MPLLLLLLPATLAATPLHPGELAGSLSDGAYTLPGGEIRLQAAGPSSVTVRDRLELKAAPFSLLSGPTLAAEVGLLCDGRQAVSVTPSAAVAWGGATLRGGLQAAYTRGGVDTDRLNLGLGVGGIWSAGARGTTTTLAVGYEHLLGEHRLLQAAATIDPLRTARSGRLTGEAGAGFLWGWTHYRLEVGLRLVQGSVIADAVEATGTEIVLPDRLVGWPLVRMWWRL